MMNKKRLNRLILLFLGILSCNTGMAQQFRYRADIGPVQATGFYGVAITPQMAARCNESLTDIRIHDAGGNQVPFIIKKQPTNSRSLTHLNINLLSEGRGADQQYFFILGNPGRQSINDLILTFLNTSANRYFSISGSDDNADWYAIRENIALETRDKNSQASFDQRVNLPLSNYRFYKLVLGGKGLVPVKLQKAGIEENRSVNNEWVSLPSPVIHANDSTDKRSYFTLQFDEAFPVSRLSLQFEGATFFQRQLRIYQVQNLHEPIQESVIRSSTPIEIPVDLKSSGVMLVVDNKDNPPLHLASVSAYMEKQTLVAYLKAGDAYSLLFGDSTLKQQPSYDLTYFRDSIPAVLVQAKLGAVEAVTSSKSPDPGKAVDRKWITWLAIGAVLLLLIFLTTRLIREVNASKDKTY